MDMPKEVWVAGMRFEIVVNDSESIFGCWGYVVVEHPARIKINNRLDMQLRRETLLHEMIHALDKIGTDHENSLVISLEKREYPRLEEKQVVLFSRLLWATLTDPRNADVVQWMLDGRTVTA